MNATQHANLSGFGWVYGAAALIVELAIVIGVGVAAYRLTAGWSQLGSWAAAAVAVVAVGLFWAMWMSPNADARLALWPRVAVASLLVLLVAAALYASGLHLLAIWFAVVGVLVMLTAQPALEP